MRFTLEPHSNEEGHSMRDIRSDLEERAEVINEQIQVAYSWFEKTVQQLERQRDERVAELKEVQATLNKLIHFENASMDNVVPLESPQAPFIDRIRATGT
jgi:hypothetical protein